jgi:hypothetical protein
VAKVFTLKLVTAFLTLAILIFVAIFMYGMFYFTFVPSPEHEGQIFLEFEPCQEVPGMQIVQTIVTNVIIV